jgi:hypothetical protein
MIKKLNIYLNTYLSSVSGASYGMDPNLKITTTQITAFKTDWDFFYKKYHDFGLPIDEISQEQSHLNLDKKWRSIFIFGFGEFTKTGESQFPSLQKFILENKKKISLVFFSTLESGKIIPPHKGNNPFVLRTQIGISIPDPENTMLRVEDKEFKLKDGEIMCFDDTLLHSAENNSKLSRTVLIIDVYKKPPFILRYIWKRNLLILKNSTYVKEAKQKINSAQQW